MAKDRFSDPSQNDVDYHLSMRSNIMYIESDPKNFLYDALRALEYCYDDNFPFFSRNKYRSKAEILSSIRAMEKRLNVAAIDSFYVPDFQEILF